jgi:aminopeptidase
MSEFASLQLRYAELVVRFGVNLQPGQCVLISAEIVARDFVAQLVEAAYVAGAKYVHVQWGEPKTARARYLHAADDTLEYFPDYEITRFKQYADETWARIALTSEEFPGIYDDVDPKRMMRVNSNRSRAIKFYSHAQMSNRLPWCVIAIPTVNWAKKVFPGVPEPEAVDKLWGLVLHMVRADLPDPVAAWRAHDARLKKISAFMARERIRGIRYLDPTPAADGKASTDLTIGLTDAPLWVGGSSLTKGGVEFMANMPTEEVFCTPHSHKAAGWVRTSKPIFPLQREVLGAYFRFENGVCVEARAESGQDVLDTFLDIPGARRLGEVSLVDVRSPVNQTGLVFYDGLFDENAVCHIAFGKAYPECVEGADAMSPEALIAFGANESDTHSDFMIGTPAMHVDGIRADGSTVAIMRDGQFLDALFA